ncbi:Tubulin tyrosine ligase [Spironucleus salmonicida]|uniref:Tubulin--tyrosine ligase-like protein 9 n=1 Tax=Spironucleus salmonicida TaxID=348837 RepID=V6LKZ9_9EUKA|nr:Tubulin tyrosine ligase [Spironucleus salmonicida]|eukprot:EST45227.1 Tubulin tyrosine ligase [Spironucleus salmonicida]
MKFINQFGKNGITSIVLQERGFIQLEKEDVSQADLIFASVDKLKDIYTAIPQKFTKQTFKISHFRNHGQITRKDMLAYHLRNAAKTSKKLGLGLDFSFLPTTFFLPMEFTSIPQNIKLIVKPACLARGAKIFIPDSYQDLNSWYNQVYSKLQIKKQQLDMNNDDSSEFIYIVQNYISPPLTLFNHKFDCRIYVLVKSFNPLNVWICDLAFARVASADYDDNSRISGLTNISVNKSNNPQELKIQLNKVNQILDLESPGKFRKGIKDSEMSIIRCLQVVSDKVIQEQACFELLGFDVLFDSDYKNYIMEANASPSLSIDGNDDRLLKKRMLHDMFSIVYDEDATIRYGCWRQIYYGSVGKNMKTWDQGIIESNQSLADDICRASKFIRGD